ncbi:hypothetical protein BH11PLA2_BH11PLA2_13470 [soil metagenome]
MKTLSLIVSFTFVVAVTAADGKLTDAEFKAKAEALQNEVKRMNDEFGKKADALKNRDALDSLRKEYSPKLAVLAKQQLELGVANPKAPEALNVARRAIYDGHPSTWNASLVLIADAFANDSGIIYRIENFAPNKECLEFAQWVAEKSIDATIKAQARFLHALYSFEEAERPWQNREELTTEQRTKKVETAAKLMADVVKEHGTVKFRSRRDRDEKTLAELAKPTLYAAENLVYGKKMPDFEAEALASDKKTKLSESRGKIVILDLYTYKGGYSHDREKMVPLLKRIAERHKDKPLAILSVSFDDQKEVTAKYMSDKKTSWPQLWMEKKKAEMDFQNSGTNTDASVFILDAEGVIRGKYVKKQDISDVMEPLLDALAKKK